LIEDEAAADAARQHAYVLLDTSRTMRDHDRRGTVARGLALAFLYKAHQERARLNLRPFTLEVGELSTGVGRQDLRAIAQRVVQLPNSGQTRIQSALEQAAADIRAAGPCLGASILLITDGISRLAANPLTHERLHTFILGDLLEEKDLGTVNTLRQWSATFHRVWKNRFAEILAPQWVDCQAAARLLEAAIRDREDPETLARLAENVKLLVKEYRRSLGKGEAVPDEVAALESWLTEASQGLAPEAASEEASRPPLNSRRAGAQMTTASGSVARDAEAAGLWQWLKYVIRRTLAWVRNTCTPRDPRAGAAPNEKGNGRESLD
jgi:hypothetical protein